MKHGYSPALDQALAAYRTPALYSTLRDRALPADLLLLLRVAARDAQAIEQASALCGESAALVSEAAVLYIQQLLFFPGSDSYRVLGVTTAAADAQVKENYRWLLRWLHPDRNEDQWDAVYADRVTLAWQDLRTPERRRDFGLRSGSLEATAGYEQGPMARRIAPALRPHQDEFLLSTRTVRRLPAAILLGVTLMAVLVLGLQYYEINEPAPFEEAAVADVAPTSAAPGPTPALQASPRSAGPQPPFARALEPVPAVATIEPAERSTQELAVAPRGEQAPPAPPAAEPAALRASKLERPVAVVAKSAERPVPPARPEAPPASPVAEAVAVSARIEPATPELINASLARDVILRFRSAYSSGNIKQMQSMLSREGAISAGEREVILESYRELFKSSDRRHMDIRNLSWMTQADTAILIASFEAWIQPRGKREEKRVSGDIRFDLRQEDGELRIVRLRHDAKGG